LLAAGLYLLTVLPFARLAAFLTVTGADTPSMDDLYFADLVGRAVAGTYDWRNFPADAFYGSHAYVAPALLYVLVGWLFGFSVVAEIALGLGLGLLILVALAASLTGRGGWPQALVWLSMSLLLFSAATVSVFEHGHAALLNCTHLVGLAVGVYGLVRHAGTWRGVWWMVAGGALASLSWAAGPGLWLVFGLGLVLLGYRRPAQYGVWLLAAMLFSSPYLAVGLGLWLPTAASAPRAAWNAERLVQAVGWPMTPAFDFDEAYRRGLWALVLGASGLTLLAIGWRRAGGRAAAASVMLLVYGLLVALMIATFRGDLAPWYGLPLMTVWIGIIGLAYALWTQADAGAGRLAGRVWAGAAALIVAVAFATSNQRLDDKTAFLRTRSPAAAACLREYRIAPTYCERILFTWYAPGDYRRLATLGEPLEAARLSVFGRSVSLTMQGDTVLGRVRMAGSTPSGTPHWVLGDSAESALWSDYHHLDLAFPTSGTASWTVTLPADTEAATLHTAVLPDAIESDGLSSGRPEFFIRALPADGPPEPLWERTLPPAGSGSRHAVALTVERYAGNTVTFQFGVRGGTRQPTVHRFEYPTLSVRRTAGHGWPKPPGVGDGPLNTDLSSLVPATGDDDLRLAVDRPESWWASDDLRLVPGADQGSSWDILGRTPMLDYQPSLDVPLADFSHLLLRIAAASELYPRAVQIYYTTAEPKQYSEGQSFIIPLLMDGGEHVYSYDLRLLGVDATKHLTSLRLDPSRADRPNGGRVTLIDLRLVRR
jgi:hypothetical protein